MLFLEALAEGLRRLQERSLPGAAARSTVMVLRGGGALRPPVSAACVLGSEKGLGGALTALYRGSHPSGVSLLG